MHRILEDIIYKTKKDLNERKRIISLDDIRNAAHFPYGKLKLPPYNGNFFEDVLSHPRNGNMAIISEIKLASPNENKLGSREDIESRVKEYQKAEVDAISVVTEKYFFKGDPIFVKQIKNAVYIPVLQKDFIIDEYQIYEVALDGADAILLIASLLSKDQLIRFVEIAKDLYLDPVVEINSEEDLQKAQASGTKIIAVNARDLGTFVVNVDKACALLKQIPDRFIKLGFSGVESKKEMRKYKKAGANGILIGTSLMKASNIKQFIASLRALPAGRQGMK